MTLKSLTVISCAALIFTIVPPSRAKDEKLKPEQLIAKHLESIGPAAKIKEMQTRMIGGAAHVDFRVGAQGSLNGDGTIVSGTNAVRAGFKFPALEYSGEQFAFNGEKASVGYLSPGNRSPLSTFIYENDMLLKE